MVIHIDNTKFIKNSRVPAIKHSQCLQDSSAMHSRIDEIIQSLLIKVK